MITTELPFYRLLQVTDSLFPSGSFAHSYGLEGLLGLGGRSRSLELRAALEAIWVGHLLRTDGLLGAGAHRAMTRGDVDAVCALDHELRAMKLARELREASVTTGRGFLGVAAALIPSADLARLAVRVESGETPGCYAIVFQAAAAAAGIGEEESLVAWGYQTIAQMVAALLRQGALGHREAQRLLSALGATVVSGCRGVRSLGTGEASSFAPGLEIASMRHERQYTRLFRS